MPAPETVTLPRAVAELLFAAASRARYDLPANPDQVEVIRLYRDECAPDLEVRLG